MLNTVYQLVAPRKFEVTYENIGLQDDDIIVRPTLFRFVMQTRDIIRGLGKNMYFVRNCRWH